MKIIITAVTFIIIAGCASNSGVVPIGPETFMVSRQAATGFSGLGTLKADALEEANEYCIKQNKIFGWLTRLNLHRPMCWAIFRRPRFSSCA